MTFLRPCCTRSEVKCRELTRVLLSGLSSSISWTHSQAKPSAAAVVASHRRVFFFLPLTSFCVCKLYECRPPLNTRRWQSLANSMQSRPLCKLLTGAGRKTERDKLHLHHDPLSQGFAKGLKRLCSCKYVKRSCCFGSILRRRQIRCVLILLKQLQVQN